ncbi:restriction endonuclease subunit S [Aeromonas veronii]|uniref:restriction endonuclease subunit S n=1 Tax=Aeromonas veronii TaxID=654 RepID=UPI003BA14641
MKESVQTQQKGLVGKYYPYPEYKDSGVEWLGEVPSEWIATRLKFIASINMGQSPNSEDCNDLGIGNPFLQGNAEFGQRSPTPKQYCDSAKKNANVGDFLFSVRAPVGAVNIADQRYGIGRGLCAIRSHEDIAHLYLWWVLQTSKIQFDAISTGSTFEAVSSEQVCNFALAIPSKYEQHTIATFLDYETARIDRLIAQQQRLIELLKEKRQAVISQAVTKGLNPNTPMKDSGVEWLGQVPEHWVVTALKRYWGVVDCKHITAEFIDDGIPLASIREVQSWEVDLSNAKQTSEEYYNALIDGGRIPENGDIIYSRNATVGEAARVTAEHPRFAMGQDVCLLKRIRKCIDTDFFMYQLKSRIISYQLDTLMVGSTFKRINVDDIRNFVVVVPPEDEAVAIRSYLNDFDRKYKNIEQSASRQVSLLQERRTALISAAVTGKIDLRGWTPPAEEVAA